MATYIDFQPSDYFANILTLTGTGATRSVTYSGPTGDVQPDMVWAKCRDTTYDQSVMDSVRGATKHIKPNTTAIEGTTAGGLTAFNSDGFTMGGDGDWNQSAKTYVYWSWKAGTTSGIATNGSTTITPTAYSFNQTAGISILKFTGNYTNGAKLAHGLGVAPDMVFFKTLENVSTWGGYNKFIGATKYIKLDSSDAATAYALAFDDTEPDAVNITLGSWEAVNGNVGTTGMVAYAFASKSGYSKFGTYSGNGNADGPMLYTGFRPSMVIIKNAGAAEAWRQWDFKREGYNPTNDSLSPNNDWVEAFGGTPQGIDILSNGIKITSSNSEVNTGGTQYIYCAWAQFPTVSSNGIPVVAR